MKTLTLSLATLALSASVATASDFYGAFDNADLYDGLDQSRQVPLAVQPGVGDSYGGSVFDHTGLDGLNDNVSGHAGIDIYGAFGRGNIDLE